MTVIGTRLASADRSSYTDFVTTGGQGNRRALTIRPFEGLAELKAELAREQAGAAVEARNESAPSSKASSKKKVARGTTGEPLLQTSLTHRPFEATLGGGLPGEASERAGGSDAKARQEISSRAPRRRPREKDALDDEAAFFQAMAGVQPLKDGKTIVPRAHPASRPPPSVDENRKALDYLRDLVDGVVPFDIADTDEYIEGAVQGLDRRLVRKLRRGEYAIQAHLDLHGMTRDEARLAVAKFIRSSHQRGYRCVLIVHGRGLNSKDQIPVLKEKLKAWLTRGAIGTKVLAFTTARPYDGGAGAAYVLLRR